MREKIYRTIAISVIMVLLICNINVFSMEVVSGNEAIVSGNEAVYDDESVSGNEAVSDNSADSVIVQADSVDNEIISVVLPSVEVSDTYSFYIDPQNILYNSYADSDEVTVEEGAHMLFINRADGGCSLSGTSDKLDVINMSTVPVEITAVAYLENVEEINILDSRPYGESSTCDMYLALVDDTGNEYPIPASGEVSFTVILDKAPNGAYAYEYDEESGEYVYASQLSDIAFDSFSMGLTGDCSATDNWANISQNPIVRFSWIVEPIIENEVTDEDIVEDDTDSEDVESVDTGETVSDNTALEPDVDGDDTDDADSEEGTNSVPEGDSSVSTVSENASTVSENNITDTGEETSVSDNNLPDAGDDSMVPDNDILNPEDEVLEEDDL